MTEQPMRRRRLPEALYPLAITGVALLRLHALRDPTAARACIDELRRLLAAIDDDASLETSTPLVDVATGYSRWAAVYDLPGNPLVACEEPTVREILDGWADDPVLDAACGTGRHLAYLAERGRRVIGTDQSPEMLAKAREKVPAADLRVGDLLELPVGDGEVAAVVCALALDHVDDLPRAYAEFARVTRPGGSIVVSTMHPVLRSVYGWGAWFIDEQGKTDVTIAEHTVGDHLNAAAAVALVSRRCEEPASPPEAIPDDMAIAKIAYDGVPMILVLEFERR